jgi:hypothetical protein
VRLRMALSLPPWREMLRLARTDLSPGLGPG